MSSKFWAFVEACDETQSIRAVRELFASVARSLDFETYAILTHAPPGDLRSLEVQIHNWPTQAMDYLFANEDCPKPLFDMVERATGPVLWTTTQRRDLPKRYPRAWFNHLRALLSGGEGVSAALRSTIVGASCTLTGPSSLDPERVRLCMRIANYAYQQALHLQRPQLAEQERLTVREHQLLYRATVLGERPSDVAHQVGVKISTVRTLRQKASVRLDSGSQEQAAWRLLETGQLFRSGRKGRPRAR